QFATARDICGGCNNYRVATRQSQTGAGSWREHCIARRYGERASGGDDVGNYGDATNSELVLFDSRGRDGLRVELRSDSSSATYTPVASERGDPARKRAAFPNSC